MLRLTLHFKQLAVGQGADVSRLAERLVTSIASVYVVNAHRTPADEQIKISPGGAEHHASSPVYLVAADDPGRSTRKEFPL